MQNIIIKFTIFRTIRHILKTRSADINHVGSRLYGEIAFK